MRAVPEAPSVLDVSFDSSPSSLPNLVAISVAPAPPEENIVVPPGSRAGEFAASPEGTGEQSGPSIAAQNGSAKGAAHGNELIGEELAEIHIPGLSVSGGTPPAPPAPLRVADPAPDLRKLMASVSRPSLAPEILKERPIESEYFGSRRVYTVYMNMPNLASGAGSWVLRFAEPEGKGKSNGEAGEIATPQAIRKVDPMYIPSAAREKVEGTVTLAALVLRDGTVANIRVVGSLDPRLDSSAVSALTQWRFQPARRNGDALDLEVLIQIPFRLASQ